MAGMTESLLWYAGPEVTKIKWICKNEGREAQVWFEEDGTVPYHFYCPTFNVSGKATYEELAIQICCLFFNEPQVSALAEDWFDEVWPEKTRILRREVRGVRGRIQIQSTGQCYGYLQTEWLTAVLWGLPLEATQRYLAQLETLSKMQAEVEAGTMSPEAFFGGFSPELKEAIAAARIK